jgi:hypothetical protein
MIELAQARSPGVTFHLADAREFLFEQNYDLAVAHFFFDCFMPEELQSLLTRIHATSWLVSEFQRTRWSWPILRGLYFFFRLTTGLRATSLPEHRATLSSLGYRIEKQHSALGGLIVSELWRRE